MIDFYSFDEYSIPLWIKVLFWGLYMVVFVYAVQKTQVFKSKYKRDVEVSYLIVLFFAIYAVFYCVNPDYFRYREWVRIPYFLDWGKEYIYLYFIDISWRISSKFPFEVFRLIVWGGGLLLVLYTARMYRSLLKPGLTVLFLFVFFSGTFCYARASLAMALYFWGVAFYLWWEDSTEKKLGIVMAICSYFLHHEMIIGIAALPALLLPFEKKKSRGFSLILLAIIIGGITYINSNLELMESIFGNDELAGKMEELSNQEQGVFRISTFVKYANIGYPFFLITKIVYRHVNTPKAIVGIYRITFVIILATVAFFVVAGSRSTYTYRVMYIAIIPLSILTAYCYTQGYFKRQQLVIMFILALLTNSIRLINAS